MINFNQAAENNKKPILTELKRILVEPGALLEIGSGSGQHVLYMAELLQDVIWQPTEMAVNLSALAHNLTSSRIHNILQPFELEVGKDWPNGEYRYAYAANVLHIMSEKLLPSIFKELKEVVQAGGIAVFYGPFKYNGYFTTDSNKRFDEWLRKKSSEAGIRDIEMVLAEAHNSGFTLIEDIAMPANNQLLVFSRQ